MASDSPVSVALLRLVAAIDGGYADEIYVSGELREMERKVSDNALEDAAKVCDAEVENDPGGLGGRAYNCARKIRDRKRGPHGPVR